MDFELTREQKDIKKAARELGLLGLFIPEEYGGPGFGFLEHAMVLEEFWRVDPGIGQQMTSITFGAEELLLFGTEEQKKKWLPPLFSGDSIMSFAITEPDAGSDTASASTSAVLDGDEYVINGSKIMIGNGTVAKFLLVFCRTDPDVKSRHGRHSIIIVETDRQGYQADPMRGKMGIRAADPRYILTIYAYLRRTLSVLKATVLSS